jgi:dihydroorotase
VGFQESPPGVIGLELALPLLWQNLVEKNLLSPLNLWRALSINPLICLNQKQIDISTGKSTELILFDPHKTWNCNKKNIKSLSKNTPFWDQLIKGKILKTHI